MIAKNFDPDEYEKINEVEKNGFKVVAVIHKLSNDKRRNLNTRLIERVLTAVNH